MNWERIDQWKANLRLGTGTLIVMAMAATALTAQLGVGLYRMIKLGPANDCTISAGSGAPEGALTGVVCDLYLRTNGGSATTLYVKESGSGNTGWAAAGSGAGGGGTVVRKTADETVTSSTTLQNDDHLTFAIAASQVMVARYILFVDAGGTGDLKLGLSVPASGTYTCGSGAISNSTANTVGAQATSTTTVTVGGLGAGTVYQYVLDCTVVNSTTAGNVVLQWAQNTSDGTGTILKTNSVVIVGSPSAVSSGSGALVLLETQTASASASLNFAATITATYDDYVFEFINLVPASDAVALWMRMSTDGGASYDTAANYSYATFSFHEAATGTAGGTAQTKVVVNGSYTSTASYSLNGRISLFNPGGAIFKGVLGTTFARVSSGDAHRVQYVAHGAYDSTTAVNAVQFLNSSGNITSGIIRSYGIAK